MGKDGKHLVGVETSTETGETDQGVTMEEIHLFPVLSAFRAVSHVTQYNVMVHAILNPLPPFNFLWAHCNE